MTSVGETASMNAMSDTVSTTDGASNSTPTDGTTFAVAASSQNHVNETEICNSLSLENNSSTVYTVFSLVLPSDATHWEERTTAYWVFFYTLLAVFGFLFLCLAVGCILLLAKRHLAQRFKVRTFIAIDVALMVLGFSRVVFLIFDPWGQSGFCRHYACVVISRLLGALAFPSLTAGYTLVLITLWISARMQIGMSCIQRLKVLIPLCFVHYGVAVVFEIMGSIPTENNIIVVILLLSCEATFSLWGFLVCFSFLITGHRLLNKVEKSARSSSVICRDSPNITRHDLIERSKLQNQGNKGKQKSHTTMKLKHMLREHHRRAIRKVCLITYITVLLGMLYSIVSFTNLILVCFSFFYGCPGYLGDNQMRQNPGVWLMFRYISLTLELLLAVLLTYSISDYQPILNLICCGLRKVGSRPGSPSGVDSCTIDSEIPSKPFPSSSDGSAVPFPRSDEMDSDTKDDDFNLSSTSSTHQLKSPTRLNSVSPKGTAAVPSSPSKRVTILENSHVPTTVNRNSSNSFHPKCVSPLTISHNSVSD